MKTETIDRLKKIYQPPVTLFDATPTLLKQTNGQCNCSCSLRQKTQMMSHLEEGFDDLEHLCNQVNLKVHSSAVKQKDIERDALLVADHDFS